MLRRTDFYIDGQWVAPAKTNDFEVINPADETVCAVISLGSAADVDSAVAAASRAFPSWSALSLKERVRYLQKLADAYAARMEDMAQAITMEMGAPITMSIESQAPSGLSHLLAFIKEAEDFSFDHILSDEAPSEHIAHEPIGVCGLITPWNWPINQVALKVIPALAVGCTVVLKPSELAPLSALILAEMIDEAGFPAGVFNLVNGDGPGVGEVMSNHEGIDMMSFTGSTRAGMSVTKGAANTIKRVSLELGGKSPWIVFADADVERAVRGGVELCFSNTGQSCDAPTRMLVERSIYDQAVAIASATAEDTLVGDPREKGDHLGPVVSETQFNKVQGLIEVAIGEGARLVAGGPGRPEGLKRGYYVKPTVFADVNNDMRIAREEVFGPVLVIIAFDNEEEAIEIANDTPYGLAAYVQSGNQQRAQSVARRLRVGMVMINGAEQAAGSPFGGYKQSGNGREGGKWGLGEFLEVKSISGWQS